MQAKPNIAAEAGFGLGYHQFATSGLQLLPMVITPTQTSICPVAVQTTLSTS